METAKPIQGIIELEDGTVFTGDLFGCVHKTEGEVVFNTGMVGYIESLTDPSYHGQILVLTYPLIGNYGVPSSKENHESDRIQVRGLVVASKIDEYSHWDADMSLAEWLESENIVGITGVDTRELTRKLREKGTMLGRITCEENQPFNLEDPNEKDLVSDVTCAGPVVYRQKCDQKTKHIVVVDCGCKRSIVRALLERGFAVTAVPYNYDFTKLACDGILLSNGPGDPVMCAETVKYTEKILASPDPVPVVGICLGCQIMALAAGGETYKLPYGHRSQNQPVREEGTETCLITSQNHGYAVASDSLPPGWRVWYRNLNDQTIEGIRHESLPFFSVQFHPEASPGPMDSMDFFDRFARAVKHE